MIDVMEMSFAKLLYYFYLHLPNRLAHWLHFLPREESESGNYIVIM